MLYTFPFEEYKSKVNFLDLSWNCYSYEMIAWWSIMIQKEWEIRISKFIQLYHSFYPVKCFLDIGANFGYHTLTTARLIQSSDGIVHAFEPQIQNFALLEENVNDNQIKNVHVYNYACGNKKEKVKIPIIHTFQSTKENAFNINMGDFTPNYNINENDESSYDIVDTILLDDFNFENVDLVKIDVQGWEKKVLQGMEKIMEKSKPVIIIEIEEIQLNKVNITSKDLFDYIREKGYYIFLLDNPDYAGDHVCVHCDKLDDFQEKFDKYISENNKNSNINNNLINGVNLKITMDTIV